MFQCLDLKKRIKIIFILFLRSKHWNIIPTYLNLGHISDLFYFPFHIMQHQAQQTPNILWQLEDYHFCAT